VQSNIQALSLLLLKTWRQQVQKPEGIALIQPKDSDAAHLGKRFIKGSI